MKFTAFNNGYCTADKKYINKKAESRKIKFPATFFCLEISGIKILIDTGYSVSLLKNAGIAAKLYSFVTKVKCKKDADEILLENNINPDEIQYIIISHFHPDHYGSLKKFPKALVICSDEAAALLTSGKMTKIRNLVFEKLISGDIGKRIIKMEDFPEIKMFENKFFNILNLNEVYGFYLDGHAKGQIGLYLKSLNKLLIFDAVWSKENLDGAEPRKILKKVAFTDEGKYESSLEKIKEILHKAENTLHTNIEPVITHDEKFLVSPYEF